MELKGHEIFCGFGSMIFRWSCRYHCCSSRLAKEYGYGIVVLSCIAVIAQTPKDLCHLFTHILQDYFTGTIAIAWLSHPEGYRFSCIIILHHWTLYIVECIWNYGANRLWSPVHSSLPYELVAGHAVSNSVISEVWYSWFKIRVSQMIATNYIEYIQ